MVKEYKLTWKPTRARVRGRQDREREAREGESESKRDRERETELQSMKAPLVLLNVKFQIISSQGPFFCFKKLCNAIKFVAKSSRSWKSRAVVVDDRSRISMHRRS